jgi:hypothetical protein
MQERESGPQNGGEVGQLGTGQVENDDGNEPAPAPQPGVVGGGDQGAHPGSLGGERGREFFGEEPGMSEGAAPANEGGDEERERFYSELDWDDIAEAFIGSLVAGLVLLLLFRALSGRGRKRG